MINGTDFLGINETHTPAQSIHALVLIEVSAGGEFTVSKTMDTYIAILPITVIRAHLLKLPQRSGVTGTVAVMTSVLWDQVPLPSIITI